MQRCSINKSWSDELLSNKSLSDVMSHGTAKRLVMHKTGTTMGVIGVELKQSRDLKF